MDLFLRGPEVPQDENASVMRRYAKPLLVAAAAIAALILTVTRQGEGPGVTLGPSPLAAASDGKDYDLGALAIFQHSLHRVKENYVDPARLDPKHMLASALDYVERSVAEVIVNEDSAGKKITIRIDDDKRSFDISGVDSPWALANKLKEIFRFVQKHVHKGTDVRDIEYAAVNGLLSTLDPHSQLLKPELYNEMRLSTRGEFGGLGIVIGIRRGKLTIIKPIDGTPASRAGLKANDRIAKINEESTVNMTLQEAVSRLRGRPKSKVLVWVERKGFARAKKFVLTRDRITIQSVSSRMLKGRVAYMAIENFQGNTYDHLLQQITKLRRNGAKGLVLDLRNNPGGLLDQAVKIADAFVEHGTIVTTVGMAGRQREPKRAHMDGDEGSYPIAVLVNESSASASEIVAGALKNLGRAIIIGRSTFGKGTVQVLYENDDGSALKLTIAQYLTPGNVSIQEVGITPDIVMKPVWIEKGKPPRYFADVRHYTREADLADGKSLKPEGVRAADKPIETVYYLEDPPRWWGRDDDDMEMEDTQDPEPDDFVEDPEIRFARDLVSQSKPGRRQEVLAALRGFLSKRILEETSKIETAFAKSGVRWTSSSSSANSPGPVLEATVVTDPSPAKVVAGQTITITVKVKNNGAVAAHRVRAMSKSTSLIFDQRELFFGEIPPGAEVTAERAIRVPRNSLGRVDDVSFEIASEGGELASAASRFQVVGLARPLFAYGYQVIDDEGNGDGLVQKGERVKLRVNIRNVGAGKALSIWTTLRNLSGPGLFINRGRFNLGDLASAPLDASVPVASKDKRGAPKPSVTAEFDFEVKADFPEREFTLELAVYDSILREHVSEKLKFPLDQPAHKVQSASGNVKLARRDVDVRGGADGSSPVIGRIGGVVGITGRAGGFLRIDLDGKPGFVSGASTQPTSEKVSYHFQPSLLVTPPVLRLEIGKRTTKGETYRLQGTATDDVKVADLYVLVSNREAKIDGKKIFYLSNHKRKNPSQLVFKTDVPLWPGPNHVTVVARENDEVQSRTTVVITRE